MNDAITITRTELERLIESIVERKLAARIGVPKPTRHYPPRKAISVPLAVKLTGLSTSTIKRLDKNPGHTNYPGRNTTAKILAAWAQLYRFDKRINRQARAANRPLLGAECR